jgi:hypothetical protein
MVNSKRKLKENRGLTTPFNTTTMNKFTLKSSTVNAAADLLEANLIKHTIDGNDIIVAEHYTDGVKMLFRKHLILFVCA